MGLDNTIESEIRSQPRTDAHSRVDYREYKAEEITYLSLPGG